LLDILYDSLGGEYDHFKASNMKNDGILRTEFEPVIPVFKQSSRWSHCDWDMHVYQLHRMFWASIWMLWICCYCMLTT